jgi:hypothetical protein
MPQGEQLEMDKSKIFIASSSRALVLAEKLRDELDTEFSQATLWKEESKTQAGSIIIEWLESVPKGYDFAVTFLSKDDVLLTSGDRQNLKARDNCVFEAGLFMSAIGRKRCFLVNSVSQSDLPSDLGGIISIPFKEPPNLQDRRACALAILQVAGQLKDIVQRVGPRRPQITITSPRTVLEGGKPDDAARRYPVLGTLTHLPDDHTIWVLNEGDRGKVWPQSKVVWHSERSEWEGSTFVWNSQPSIKIVAVVAPPTSNQLFEFYQVVHEATKEWVAIPRLPGECTVVDRVHPHKPSPA